MRLTSSREPSRPSPPPRMVSRPRPRSRVVSENQILVEKLEGSVMRSCALVRPRLTWVEVSAGDLIAYLRAALNQQ